MKRHIVYIKSIFLLTLVVFLYGFASLRNDSRIVKGPVIEFSNGINLFLSHEMVDKLLKQNLKSLGKEPKSLINLHTLEMGVLSNPLVEEAKVFLTVDGVLNAVVKQRTPVLRVHAEDEVYYVDDKGFKMPMSDNYSARVMLASGAISERDIASIFELVTAISGNDFLKKMIVGIEKKSTDTYLLHTRKYRQQIHFGAIQGVRQKIKKLEAFYNEVIQSNEVATYKVINLKYNNQVVCTK
jgi:cell division protein FtsQ